MQSLTQAQNADFFLEIYDGINEDPETLIYDSNAGFASTQQRKPTYTINKLHNIYQQKWTLVWKSTAAFEARHENNEAVIILTSGCIFTVLLGIYLMSLFERADTIQRTVVERTEALQQSEKKLRISNERLEMAWSGAGDGMWDWNIPKNEVIFSDRFKEMLGYKPDELNEEFEEWSKRLHPSDRLHVFEKLTDHLKRRDPYDVEYRLQVKSGEWRWFRARGQAIWGSTGEAVRMSGSLSDVTEMKEAERKLFESNEKLSESNITLEKLIAKLSESNTELERFAYVASHDMQEPLRMISNFSQLLQKEYEDKLAKEGKEYLSIIATATIRMQKFVSDLLEYARAVHSNTAHKSLDADHEARLAVQALQQVIDQYHAKVTVEPLPQISGNPIQFGSLLQNLISNCLKYHHPERVPEVHIATKQQGGYWLFSVQDNGAGIKPEFFDKIFEPFIRLHGQQEAQGTGVGLALCKRIVENHGGKIWVQSKMGEGSVFYFTWPQVAMERKGD